MRGMEFVANVILPGLMNTPMAIENRIGVLAATREEVIARATNRYRSGGKMGTAWDVANAALSCHPTRLSSLPA